MIIRPCNREVIIRLTHDILNNIRKHNILDFWQIHSIQVQIDQKPNECLQELCSVLQQLSQHHM